MIITIPTLAGGYQEVIVTLTYRMYNYLRVSLIDLSIAEVLMHAVWKGLCMSPNPDALQESSSVFYGKP